MEKITTEKLHDIRHKLASCGQIYHSYAELLRNPQFRVSRNKEIEIMSICKENCLKVIQLILEAVEREEK